MLPFVVCIEIQDQIIGLTTGYLDLILRFQRPTKDITINVLSMQGTRKLFFGDFRPNLQFSIFNAIFNDYVMMTHRLRNFISLLFIVSII